MNAKNKNTTYTVLALLAINIFNFAIAYAINFYVSSAYFRYPLYFILVCVVFVMLAYSIFIIDKKFPAEKE